MTQTYKQLNTVDEKIRRAISDPELGSAIIESIAAKGNDVVALRKNLRRTIRLSRILTQNLVEELKEVDPEFAKRKDAERQQQEAKQKQAT